MTRSPEQSWDLLVVGAGPAGAMAAREAAGKGARVLVVEAKENLGERCHCAEWVPSLLALEVDIARRVRQSRMNRLESRAGEASAQAQVSGLVIERKIWEKELALAAIKAGAVIRSGVRFRGWAGRGLVRLESGLEGPETARTGAVIAADGGLSRVASSLGLARQPGVPAIQLEVEAGPALGSGQVRFRPDLLGYLWLFPKGGSANLGLGGEVLGSADLKQMLADWRGQALEEGLIGPSILRRGGGFIPTGGPRERLALEAEGVPVLLAGDAAGLTHPTTGAGIPQAVRSGLMAGQAFLEYTQGRKEAPAEYEKAVLSFLGGYLKRGLKLREKAAGIWQSDFEQAVRAYWPLWPKRKPVANP